MMLSSNAIILHDKFCVKKIKKVTYMTASHRKDKSQKDTDSLQELMPADVVNRAQQIVQVLGVDRESITHQPSPYVMNIAKQYFAGDPDQAFYALKQVALDIAAWEKNTDRLHHSPISLQEAVHAEIKDFIAFDAELRAKEGRKQLNLAAQVTPYDTSVQSRAEAMIQECQAKYPEEWEVVQRDIMDAFTAGDAGKANAMLLAAALEVAVNEHTLQKNFTTQDVFQYLLHEVGEHAAIMTDLDATDPSKAQLQASEELGKMIRSHLSSLSIDEEKLLCKKLKPLGGNPLDELHDSMLMLISKHDGALPALQKPSDLYHMLDQVIEERLHQARTGQQMYRH